MILLSRHGLTPVRKVPMESMQLNLTERDSSASFTPVDMDGISLDNWMLDDDGPGAGAVYRVKSITQNYGTRTPRVMLEHVIKQLGDRLIFGERGPEEITGTTGATTCTAKQAIEYALDRQSDWVLGTFDYNNVSGAYKFNGETILECVEKVCNTLQDCWWSYDFSSYPFTLNITQKSSALGTVLRANRNLAGVQKTVDRSGMVTRFYPIGKNDKHITGSYVDKNVDVYGVASRVETDESLETEAELTAWANEYLDRHAEPIITINVDALELAEATGETLDQLQLGKKCRVMMEEFGEEITETIVSISYNDKVKQPEVAKVTLANNRQDATKLIAEAVKQTRRSSRSTAYNNRKVCVGAVVVGNTLTLTFGDGSEVNFNKGGSGTGTISGIACTAGAVETGQTRTSGTVRVSGTNIDNAPFDKLFSMDKEAYRPSGASIDTAAVYFMLDGVKIARYADANLVEGNIKDGVTIMGITGTYQGSGSSGSIDSVQVTAGAISGDTTVRSSMTVRASGTNVSDKDQEYTLQNAIHSSTHFVEMLEGTNNPIVVGRISTESVYTAGYSAGAAAAAGSIDSLKMDGSALGDNTTTRTSMTERASGTNVSDRTQGYTLQKAFRSETNHPNMNFVELLEGTNSPIIVGRINVESVFDAGVSLQLEKMVPFIGSASNTAYNSRTTRITSNGTYYACAEGYKSHYNGYDNANYSSDRYASAKSFTVAVPTGGGTPTVSALSIVSSASGTSKGTISATEVNNSRGKYLQWTVNSTTYYELIQ